MKNNTSYYLSPSGTLHIRGVCKDSKGILPSEGRNFETENQVYANVGMHFKWCKECIEWRENLIQNTLKQQKDDKYLAEKD